MDGKTGKQRLVAINYAGKSEPMHVRLPAPYAGVLRFRDAMGALTVDRDGRDLDGRGLYLDMEPWGHHVFEVTAT